MPPMNPGHNATLLVTFAATGGIPSAVITGNEISVPPPATAFTAPAASAAAPNSKSSAGNDSGMRAVRALTGGFLVPDRERVGRPLAPHTVVGQDRFGGGEHLLVREHEAVREHALELEEHELSR